MFTALEPNDGWSLNFLQIKSSMRSFSNLNVAVKYAIIEDDLFQLMNDEKSNGILQQFLLDEYFPDIKYNFIRSIDNQQRLLGNIEDKILREDPIEYRLEIKKLIKKKMKKKYT